MDHADGITLYGNPRLADLSALERLGGVGAVVAIGAERATLTSIARVASGDVTLASDADSREFSFDFD